MRYSTPIYTSLVNFVFPFDILVFARSTNDADNTTTWDKFFVILSFFRYVLSLCAIVIFVFSEEHWRYGLVLLLISLSLYYMLSEYIFRRVRHPNALQQMYVFANLALSPVNFLIDIGGETQPIQHAAHFLLVLAAITFGALVHTVLKPLHKAYGCYPATTPWYELDKGLCPQFFGDPNDPSRSPICRDGFEKCSDINRPQHIVYRHIFMVIAGSAVLLYYATLPAKMFRMGLW